MDKAAAARRPAGMAGGLRTFSGMHLCGHQLTPIQTLIIDALMDGYTANKDIGKLIGLSPGTIKAHLRNIAKLISLDQAKFLVKPRVIYLVAVERGMLPHERP